MFSTNTIPSLPDQSNSNRSEINSNEFKLQYQALVLEKKQIFPNAVASKEQERLYLKKRVYELANLEDNWDGYGAIAISRKIIDYVLGIIDMEGSFSPEISPQSNGTISLEWVANYGEAYLEIGNLYYSGYISLHSIKKPFTLEGQSNSINQTTIHTIFHYLLSSNASSPTITSIKIKFI